MEALPGRHHGPESYWRLPAAGWHAEFSNALEGWHAEHGVFPSEGSYRGIWHLCMRALDFAGQSTAAKDALGNLRAAYNLDRGLLIVTAWSLLAALPPAKK